MLYTHEFTIIWPERLANKALVPRNVSATVQQRNEEYLTKGIIPSQRSMHKCRDRV